MKGNRSTADDWREFEQGQLYYAVMSVPESLEADAGSVAEKESFFESGQRHFDRVVELFEDRSRPLPSGGSALDFGCGVGRLLRPMSERFGKVIGVDVSAEMLSECERNLEGRAALLHYNSANDLRSQLERHDYDFLLTCHVLQHIRPDEGLELLDILLGSLRPGGAAYVSAPLVAKSRAKYLWRQMLYRNRKLARTYQRLRGDTLGLSMPMMEMHAYPVEALMPIFDTHGCEVVGFESEPTSGLLHHANWYLSKLA